MRILWIPLFIMISVIFTTKANATKSPTLNTTKEIICVGKKMKLKVKNTDKKVAWSSSDKKVVKVCKKGVIKGLEKGEATIMAKVGSKMLKCQIKVKAAVPVIHTILSVENAKSLGINYRSDEIYCKSSNKKVATATIVDDGYDFDERCSSADIMVYGHKSGTATIIITNNCNNEKRKMKVVVDKPEATTDYDKLVNHLLLYGEADEIGDKSISNMNQDTGTIARILYDPMADEINYEYEETNEFGHIKWLVMPTEKDNTEVYVVMWLYPAASKEEYYVTTTIDSNTYRGETILFEKGWYREPAEEILQPVANAASQRAFQSIGMMLKENTGMTWKDIGFLGLS